MFSRTSRKKVSLIIFTKVFFYLCTLITNYGSSSESGCKSSINAFSFKVGNAIRGGITANTLVSNFHSVLVNRLGRDYLTICDRLRGAVWRYFDLKPISFQQISRTLTLITFDRFHRQSRWQFAVYALPGQVNSGQARMGCRVALVLHDKTRSYYAPAGVVRCVSDACDVTILKLKQLKALAQLLKNLLCFFKSHLADKKTDRRLKLGPGSRPRIFSPSLLSKERWSESTDTSALFARRGKREGSSFQHQIFESVRSLIVITNVFNCFISN